MRITNPAIRAIQTPETQDELLAWFEIGKDNYKLSRLIDHYLSPGTEDWERDFGDLWDLHTLKGDDYHK